MLESRRRVCELLDIKPETLRGWIERKEIDVGQRLGWRRRWMLGSRSSSARAPSCAGPTSSSRRRQRFRQAELDRRLR